MSNGRENQKRVQIKDFWGKFSNYVLSSFIVLAVYFVFMLALNTFAHKLFVADKDGEVFFSFLGEYGWWIIYALAYGIPLYFIHFKRDNELKTFVLHITENDYDIKNIFKQFTLQYAKTDIVIYAIYSALMLLPFKDPFNNPAVFITYHQLLFYALPIPRIVGYICVIISFIPQYYACFWFAHRKNRIHKNKD